MAVPTAPATPYIPGNIPTASDFNTYIKNAINFFLSPPRCTVKSTAGTISRADRTTWSLLPWNSEVTDTDGMHDNSTNNSRLICQTAGMYHVWLNVNWEEHNVQAYDGERGAMIRINSAGAVGSGHLVGIDHRASNSNPLESFPASQQGVSAYVAMAVNDYVEAFVYDNDDDTVVFTPTGCYIDTTTYAAHRFGMQWVSI